jgi:hypothetical protein
LRPASTEAWRVRWNPASVYSGTDSSSRPMKKVKRSSAPAISIMPAALHRISTSCSAKSERSSS